MISIARYNVGTMNPPNAKKRNVRDLSYLSRPDGKRLKENVFYRSGALKKFSRKDLRFFQGINLETVIDLRTPGEIAKKPDPELPGVEFIECPLLTEETLGITHERGLKAYKEPPHMPDLYAQIVTEEASIAGIATAIKRIMDPKREGPILWHCTAGKDRCGLVTAIFLRLLGFKMEDIFADYVLSDEESEKKGRLYRRLIKIFLRRKETAEAVYLAMRADVAYLQSAFDAIKRTVGSFANFVSQKLGIRDEDIQAFVETNMA